MKASKLFAKKLKNKLAQKQDEMRRQPGVMGNGAGGLVPVGLTNFVYVTIADKVMPVFNNRVSPQIGVKVWVGYASEEPTLFQVLSTRSETPAGAEEGHVGYAPAKRYEWNATGGGQDPLHVHLRAFSPLKLGVSALGGMYVNLYKGTLHNGVEYLTIARQDIDLTAHLPTVAGKAALVMISIDSSGAVVQTKGSEVDITALSPTDRPIIPAGAIFVCGCVRVYTGQTEIREGRVNTDFDDLRFMSSPGYIPYTQQVDTKDPTGWVDPDNIAVSYNATNRTITLTGTLEYYWRGRKYELTSPWTSTAHTNAAGQYYLYSTDGAAFTWSTSAWAFYQLMVAKAVVTASDAFALREVHGLMPWQVHEELHEVVSAFRESGGDLTAGTYTVNTATDSANSPGFDAAQLQDEDLHTTIPAWVQGTYTTMRIGASSVATFDVTAALPFRHGASYIYYNTPSTGAETAAANNRYLNVYQILVPTASDSDSQKYRTLMLQPQAQYTSLTAAQAEDPRVLILGDLTTSAPEFVIYARITYVTASGDANNGKCRIATGGISYLAGTKLSQVSVSGFVAPTAENIPFTPAGTISATNVQAAIEEVAAEAGGGYTPPTTTAANDFQVGDGAGAWIKKTLAEVITILRTSLDAIFALRLAHSSISPTTANQTAAVNTRYFANISGLTANRNFIIPAGAVGDEIELSITTGDDTYSYIIIGDTGITINGGSAATEWSRLLITGETIKLVATSTSNWQVVHDGRKPCRCRVRESTAQTIANTTATDLTYNTADIDNCGMATLAGSPDGITIRRAGNYSISSSLQMGVGTYTRLLGNVTISGGAEITRAETSGVAYESLVFVAMVVGLVVGNKLVTGVYQISGGSKDTILNTCHMEAVEIL
jgi:hypothetical protein